MSIDFYYERQVLEQDMREQGDIEADEIIGFGFMENYSVLDEKDNEIMIPGYLGEVPLTYADFLHGFCHIFALRLHNEYGYRIENLYDEDGSLIHSYCRTPDGGYVDIRGISYDTQVFFDEFADWLDPANPYLCGCNNAPAELIGDNDKRLYNFTTYILRDYSSCYTK